MRSARAGMPSHRRPVAAIPQLPLAGASLPQPAGSQIILLAVTGMSPAVLTETVWALAHEEPPVIPDRVVAVTTIAGRQAIERELLTPPSSDVVCVWQQLRLALLGPQALKQERLILEPVRLVEAPNPRTGRADWLEDLRTPEENAATANFLLGETRRWTETPDTRLVVSIAGGRKTMGALLYACASLLGRETDRLTHVLVNDPFDDPRLKPRFYFPAQAEQSLSPPGGRPVLAAAARIEMADIPFVSLRNLFERDLVRKPGSFLDLVRRCSVRVEELAQREIRVSLWRAKLKIEVNGVAFATSVREHLLLLFLAQRARTGQAPLPSYAAAFDDFNRFCREVYASRLQNDYSDWRHEANVSVTADSMERFCIKAKSQLKAKLKVAGAAGAGLLALFPKAKRFSLDLPPEQITFRD